MQKKYIYKSSILYPLLLVAFPTKHFLADFKILTAENYAPA